MAKKKLLSDDYLATLMANMSTPHTIPSNYLQGPLIKHLLRENAEKEINTMEFATIDLASLKKEISSIAVKFMGKKGKLVEEKLSNTNTIKDVTTSLKDIEKFACLFLKSKIADQMLEEINWTINQSIQP